MLQDIQVDPYEPLAPEKLQQAIEEVKEFYLRNTDGEFEIVPVVLPTLTMTLPRYEPTLGPEGDSNISNPYDSKVRLFRMKPKLFIKSWDSIHWLTDLVNLTQNSMMRVQVMRFEPLLF